MTPADVQVTFCATLVDQWIDMGMQHAVVAPGSRSTPMALALAARTDLQVHVAHDERTAAFMALGVGLSTGVPAALLCTSGTAAAHFHAAVIEADLSGVPMIVLTADRPPELQGVGAPQTIDQVELYGDVVRLFADLGVPDAEATAAWRGTAVNAWLAACGIDPGPVHLNLPFREPLVGHIGELPALDPGFEGPDDEVWFMTRLSMEELAAMLTAPRGVVVAGNGVDDPDAAGALAAALGWPILADPRSGCRRLRAAVCAFDPLLRDAGFAAANRPDVVLHLGEPPASKVLGQWLQASGAVHVQVHPQGRTIDPLGIVTERVYGSVGTVCEALTPLVAAPADSTWLAGWMAAESAAQSTLTSLGQQRFDEPAVARALSTVDARLVLSSSMPVRDVEWFGAPGSTVVHSNRGANGIDGVVATAIGVAVGTDGPTVLLVGDVAFCHDQSSLTALAARALDLTVVVVDNDGGGIFSFLPQRSSLTTERFEQLFGTPHGTDLVALARAHGLGARTVHSLTDLIEAVLDRECTVVRVVSSRDGNVRDHEVWHAAVSAALPPAPADSTD
ncbi:MAG: 2-succinyl-5-enolpyruvyl-6-hydroxy-3-cyclohexene-carboxylic-acid synthase [Actinomycetota bacterium]|jgi:2-succinyl-5-enolpyruvyl-6-hydroxy-3-cyclohexene-1-carboxylate synthase